MAFDHLEWSHLFQVLENFQLNQNIMRCVKLTSVQSWARTTVNSNLHQFTEEYWATIIRLPLPAYVILGALG